MNSKYTSVASVLKIAVILVSKKSSKIDQNQRKSINQNWLKSTKINRNWPKSFWLILIGSLDIFSKDSYSNNKKWSLSKSTNIDQNQPKLTKINQNWPKSTKINQNRFGWKLETRMTAIFSNNKNYLAKASHFDVNFARRLVTRRRETSFARRRETYRKSSQDVLEISHGLMQTFSRATACAPSWCAPANYPDQWNVFN